MRLYVFPLTQEEDSIDHCESNQPGGAYCSAMWMFACLLAPNPLCLPAARTLIVQAS